jgi:hypothetical protein
MREAGGVLQALIRLLLAPFWFFDALDKESLVMMIPHAVRRRLLRILFWPTLLWTLLLHRAMPEQRRWYDRVDSRVILGASAACVLVSGGASVQEYALCQLLVHARCFDVTAQ